MHTTPGCSMQQLVQNMQELDELRRLTGSPITTAINHDINGQPWTMCPLLLDSGVSFYLTGINIHFGGIPFRRPYAFRWEAPDGRWLTSFVGEHYSMFNTFLQTEFGDTAKMEKGIRDYIRRAEESGWEEDFVFLTAANPPLCDNNSPDTSLAELIRRYNAEGHEQIIRFATPEMLYERIRQRGEEGLSNHAGDWTDYWNFGCASTPRELRINRAAKNLLKKADFLESFRDEPSGKRMRRLFKKAWENTLFFDEHTWGYWNAVGNPDQEGILIVNPTPFPMRQRLRLPSYMTRIGRNLAAARARDYLPYIEDAPDCRRYAGVEVGPFSMKRIPFSRLTPIDGKKAAGCRVSDEALDTPFYHVILRPETGRIVQIEEKKTGRRLLDENSEWGFFDLAEERVDARYEKQERSSIFPKDVEKLFHSISQWNHEWKADRRGISKLKEHFVEENEEEIALVSRAASQSMEWLETRTIFSAAEPVIRVELGMKKMPETAPVGIYFTIPLALSEDWDCVYDTMDTFVRLDEEQLGNVCRDYLTVDRTISMFDEKGGVTLACPDAPMVQAGDFHFGRENRRIERRKNPLLLAWVSNNYWDTNFAASQDGRLNFRYELTPFVEFDKKEAYRAGLKAADPCAVGAAIRCPEETERQLLFCESKGEDKNVMPVLIRPQYDGKGLLIGVMNFGVQKEKCVLRTKIDRPIRYAARTDLQGKTRQELAVEKGMTSLEVPARGLVFLRLIF
ncbi:MAG TPA: hypothetical protein H9761_17400 [Candidatus Eisenbergiella merdavium]|uniref:Alpha-mannosidase n=1 Tax=Candidatus Eisenbergiella merdavium TaxID=2838551 RepID=A0A9D2NJL0_9FIRM|nr:hypothetical protein [Candidatus Eisenbergiella merdavium]